MRLRPQLVKLFNELVCFGTRIVEPVGRPYADDVPAQTTKDFLAKAIPIPGALARMVARTVALDAG